MIPEIVLDLDLGQSTEPRLMGYADEDEGCLSLDDLAEP